MRGGAFLASGIVFDGEGSSDFIKLLIFICSKSDPGHSDNILKTGRISRRDYAILAKENCPRT